MEMTDVNLLLQKVTGLMRPFCEANSISVQLEIPDQSYMVKADTAQMEQLLLNVIKNAAESIGTDGTIRIILSPESNELRIEDSGKGIVPEVAKKIFTPFFSTKKDGQGIGLTISREIAHQHGFGISLTNRPEGGAVFTLQL
jgi:signal transduction histidine kinase